MVAVKASFHDGMRSFASETPLKNSLNAPLVDIVDGTAVLDTSHPDKHPDWSRGGADSGQYPADRAAVT